jgi:MGT family glycosyltransferase
MCLDPLAYHGVLVAETERVVWAGLSTNLVPLAPAAWDSPMARAYRALAPYRDRLFARHGVTARFKINEAISPWLNTVFTTDAFIPRDRADNDYSFYVGPALPRGDRGDETAFPWERLPDSGPIVYVSFGSQISYAEQLTVDLVRALAEQAHVVIVLKDMLERVEPALPENIVAVRYAPQLTLLDRIDVMVTHGGANSVMECLSKARPMLVIPTVNDGPLQGLLVERAGVGFTVSPSPNLAADSCERVRRMLPADSPTRRRAAHIARSYAVSDGPARIVELLAELSRTRAPLRPTLG